MIFHKRAQFGGRPCKCVDYRDRLNCYLSLKTPFKMHKQQNLSTYDSDYFANIFSSSQVHGKKKEAIKLIDFYNFTTVNVPAFFLNID